MTIARDYIDHGASPEAEASVLGCIMLDPRLLQEARRALVYTHFTSGSNRTIWRAMCSLDDEGVPVDVLAINDQLGSRIDNATGKTLLHQVGGPTAISKLSMNVVGTTSFDNALRIVLERASRRELLRIVDDARTRLNDGHGATDVIARINDGIEKLGSNLGSDDHSSYASSIAREVFADLESGESLLTRCPTGIVPVDALLDGGFALGMHYVVGARSGHGKTTLTSSVVAGLLDQNPDLHVDWYGCEVPRKWQFIRIASAWADLPESFWRSKGEQQKMLYGKAVRACGWGEDLHARLRIFHWASISMREVALQTAVRRRALGNKPLLVVVDYLQRAWGGDSDKPNERITAASSMLAELADDNTITLGLTQFGKDTSNEPVPIPKHSQASWSADILNDACDFLIYHRPCLESLPPLACLQLAKSRYGRLAHTWMLGSASNRFGSFHAPGSDIMRSIDSTHPNLDLRIPSVPGLNTGEIRP